MMPEATVFLDGENLHFLYDKIAVKNTTRLFIKQPREPRFPRFAPSGDRTHDLSLAHKGQDYPLPIHIPLTDIRAALYQLSYRS